jgi:hypothetical protein
VPGCVVVVVPASVAVVLERRPGVPPPEGPTGWPFASVDGPPPGAPAGPLPCGPDWAIVELTATVLLVSEAWLPEEQPAKEAIRTAASTSAPAGIQNFLRSDRTMVRSSVGARDPLSAVLVLAQPRSSIVGPV